MTLSFLSAKLNQLTGQSGFEAVKPQGTSPASGILPVTRTKAEARQVYDRLSRFYDLLTAAFERKYAEMALERLSLADGERVLEIGFGSGHCLKRIARTIGPTGQAHGIDISTGMIAVTRRKLEKAGLRDRVELYCGDGASLPYADSVFQAVFMSFTLELFDTPEVAKVLGEVKRVLQPGGRLGVASLSQEDGGSISLRLYQWARTRWPKYVDCRPIYLEQSLKDAGYEIISQAKVRLLGLPGEIIIAGRGY